MDICCLQSVIDLEGELSMYKKKGKERYRRMQRRKQKNYKFSDKVHPVEGIVSFALSVSALLILIITSFISFRAKGNAGIGIGLAGVLALIFCAIGVTLSFLAMRKKEIHYRFPVLGGLLSSLLLFGYILMYALGAIV